ncbi:MAG: fimbrillin family protein, partial [Bacteroides sp.]|nr:fimbrillin family protein [Bacteroides sp.]
MRHSCLFRPVSGLLDRIFVYMAVVCSVSSCTDDTFNKYQQEDTGLLTFDVKVPGNWTNGLSRAATDISIKRMSQSNNAEPLYLVTEISEVAADAAASDAAAEEAVTRGSMVNSTDDFYNNFGLSAICYTGTWPKDEPTDWSTDFAHNLKVEKKEGIWKSAEKLNWLGTGGIRFFAYSPYSSSDNGIIHSDPSKKGIPTLTYTVPTDVKKQHDLMTAMKDCSGGQGGAVDLKFEHVLTAVTIKTGKEMLAGKVTGITISGVYGKGTCQIGAKNWTLDKDNANCSFSIETEIKLDENKDDLMTKPGIELNKDEEGYTFMMIPQTLTDNAT